MRPPPISFFFFFNDTATTEIYTLSLHDALPIWLTCCMPALLTRMSMAPISAAMRCASGAIDRKSTRLNSSHQIISYAVFCLKKKKTDSIIAVTHCTRDTSTMCNLQSCTEHWHLG